MKLNQNGSTNGNTLGLIVCVVLLIFSFIFGIWAFSGKQKYQNNANQLISSAVTAAKQQQQTSDNKTYAVAAENPLIQYVGPQAFGTVSLWYPKTWSGYVDTSQGSSGGDGTPVDGYFFPGVLPTVQDNGSSFNFALRLQVSSDTYSDILQSYQGSQQGGSDTITTYSLPKLPNVVGVKIVGQLSNGNTGTLIVLPLRSEALEIWTEGDAYLTQFNNYILPNLSFSP
jgi:hypothetical protein